MEWRRSQELRQDRVAGTGIGWGPVGEKLITVGQQMGNTTVKTSQRQSTMTRDENPVD